MQQPSRRPPDPGDPGGVAPWAVPLNPATTRRPRVSRSTPQGSPCIIRPASSHAPGMLARAALPPVPSTLLIPLAARAHGPRYFPWLDCRDTVAAGLLDRLGADASSTLDDLPTVLNVLWRTRAIKDAARAFFAAHPQGLGVNLGCGLTQYFQWLDTGGNGWLDADLPEVMALRQHLLAPLGPRARHAVVNLAQPGWWQRLGLPERHDTAQPVLLVCEGVLMYLEPAQVQAVLAEFAANAPPGSRMVLDVLTRAAVGHASRHASMAPSGAEFRWGVGRVAELAQAHQRLAVLREQSVADCYGWPGIAFDALWRPWLGAPLYGVVTLGVRGGGG